VFFVKVGDKAKIRVIKMQAQDDTNIEILSGLKERRCNYRSHTIVTKELNSGDRVITKQIKSKKK
jgi:HlyD family secretion protein